MADLATSVEREAPMVLDDIPTIVALLDVFDRADERIRREREAQAS